MVEVGHDHHTDQHLARQFQEIQSELSEYKSYQQRPEDGQILRQLSPPEGLRHEAEDDLCGPQHGDEGGGVGDGHGQNDKPEGKESHHRRH